jgi:hypothetical protein
METALQITKGGLPNDPFSADALQGRNHKRNLFELNSRRRPLPLNGRLFEIEHLRKLRMTITSFGRKHAESAESLVTANPATSGLLKTVPEVP